MATDVERLVVSLEASITKYTKALQKASGDADTQAGKIERRFRNMSEKIHADTAKSVNALQGHTGNLSAQFNDIAVQLAGGQSPFLIAMQQGTQLGQILGTGGGGLRGTVSALGAAFASMVSPVNLATIATITLGGAALQYFTSGEEKTSDLNEALKNHDAVIRALKDAYGEAAEGLQSYTRIATAVADEQAQRQAEEYTAAIMKASQAAADLLQGRSFNSYSLPDFAGPIATLEKFRKAVADLEAGIAAGNPDILAFQRVMAEIATDADGASESQRAVARSTLDVVSAAAEGAVKLADLTARTAGLKAEAQETTARVSALAAAIRGLNGLSLPGLNLDDETKALNAYTEGLKNATTAGERASVEASFIAAQQRIQAANAPKPNAKPNYFAMDPPETSSGSKGGGGGNGSSSKRADSSYSDLVKRIQERIQSYNLEAEAVARFGGNVDQARSYVDLLMAAQEQGIPITDALKGSMSELAGQYAVAGDAARQAADAQREMERAAQEFADLGRDLMGGFIQDLRSGKSAAEALAGALDKVADKLLNSALDGLFGGGGGLGGVFGSLFGGGYKPTNIGGLYLAGGGHVRGPGTGTSDSIPAQLSNGEFVVNAKAARRHMDLLHAINSGTLAGFAEGGPVGMIRPATATRAAPTGGAGPVVLNNHVTVNGPSGDKQIRKMVAQGVQEGLSQFDKILPARIRDKQAKSLL